MFEDEAGENTFTEVTHEGWFSRLGNAITGVLFGLVLVFVACVLLFWNEGRTIKRYKALQAGRGAVVSVSSESVSPENEGKLVHVSGMAVSKETLSDSQFGVQQTALKLERRVEMFQWEEEKSSRKEKKLGGGEKTVTTYKYRKVWSANPIDSSGFNKNQSYQNPSAFPVQGKTLFAAHATLGAYFLSRGQVARIDGWQAMPLEAVESMEVEGRPARVENGEIYVGDNSSEPQIGDMRITYRYVPDTQVTVISRQNQRGFEPYMTPTGSVDLLSRGIVSSDALFGQAESSNAILKWVLRVIGLVLLFIGFMLVLNPLSVVGDVVPFIGSIIGVGVGLVSVVLSLSIGLIVIAVAWFAYRPMLSSALFAAAVAAVVALKLRSPGKEVSEASSQ